MSREVSDSGSPSSLSRRSLLNAGAVGLLAGSGGCLDLFTATESNDQTPETTLTEEVAQSQTVDEIDFEGEHLVVTLAKDASVSRLNLIGPEESQVASTSVATGETTAQLQILDVNPMIGSYEHYSPGTHELVVVTESGSESLEVPLEPDLSITEVEQYRDGTRERDYGRLAVTVSNEGTGPTWVYDIAYEGSQYFPANDELQGDPGRITFSYHRDIESLVILPGQKETFIPTGLPMYVDNREEQNCDFTPFEIGVTIGTGTKSRITREVRIEGNGRLVKSGPTGHSTCDKISVELLE